MPLGVRLPVVLSEALKLGVALEEAVEVLLVVPLAVALPL